MRTLTEPMTAMQIKYNRVWNEQYQEFDYDNVYSKRGGYADDVSLTLNDVYDEIYQRDDFGIVTIYCPLGKAYVEKTNLGYSVRPIYHASTTREFYIPSSMFSGSATLEELFAM